ncbi:hypothetical protein AB0A76_24745 [Streptomyces exfoliatus]|uniref:Uncharacterized protein n=1 Tax=Streptomyces exfoliatus TaxID=1905 RepID=A0ABV3D1N0_STREX
MAAAQFGRSVAQPLRHLPDSGDLTGADPTGADPTGTGAVGPAGDALGVGQVQSAEGVCARRGDEVPPKHVAPSQLDD